MKQFSGKILGDSKKMTGDFPAIFLILFIYFL